MKGESVASASRLHEIVFRSASQSNQCCWFSQWGDGLLRQTQELRRRIQAEDDVLVKIEKEREPLKQAAGERLEILDTVSGVRRSCCLVTLKEGPR